MNKYVVILVIVLLVAGILVASSMGALSSISNSSKPSYFTTQVLCHYVTNTTYINGNATVWTETETEYSLSTLISLTTNLSVYSNVLADKGPYTTTFTLTYTTYFQITQIPTSTMTIAQTYYSPVLTNVTSAGCTY